MLFRSDGFRLVAGTARIGDVELSSVSRQIQSIVAALASNIGSLVISSAVLRSKSQYRLFYSAGSGSTSTSRSEERRVGKECRSRW